MVIVSAVVLHLGYPIVDVLGSSMVSRHKILPCLTLIKLEAISTLCTRRLRRKMGWSQLIERQP
jgi:hypothetical protein